MKIPNEAPILLLPITFFQLTFGRTSSKLRAFKMSAKVPLLTRATTGYE